MQSNKKWKILIVFDYMIADILSNKKINPIVTELFIRGRKVNVCLFLIHSLISLFQKIQDWIQHTILSWKFQTKENFNKLHLFHSWDIDFQDFINLNKKSIVEPYSFLVIDTTVPSYNSLHFFQNLSETM